MASSPTAKPDYDSFRRSIIYADKRALIGLRMSQEEAFTLVRDEVALRAYYDAWSPQPQKFAKPLTAKQKQREIAAEAKRVRRGRQGRGRVLGIVLGIPVAVLLVAILAFGAWAVYDSATTPSKPGQIKTDPISKIVNLIFGPGPSVQVLDKGIAATGCDLAWEQGKAPIYEGQPGYSQALDPNHDGVACDPQAGEIPSFNPKTMVWSTTPGGTPAPTKHTGVYYRDCKAVWAALGRPIVRGEPGFDTHLDPDGNGIACETDPR